jgi:hypothetical protein
MSWSPRLMGDTRRTREAKTRNTFVPLYTLAGEILDNAVSAIRGRPVVQAWGHWMDAGDTLMSFGDCFKRLAPDSRHLDIFDTVGKRLKAGTPITKAEADALVIALRKCESVYRCTPLKDLQEAILTEQIAIELDAMNARRAA